MTPSPISLEQAVAKLAEEHRTFVKALRITPGRISADEAQRLDAEAAAIARQFSPQEQEHDES